MPNEKKLTPTANHQDVDGPVSAEQRRIQYNRAVREARLTSLHLLEVTFKIDRQRLTDAGDKKLGYSGGVYEIEFDPEQGACASRCQWKVELRDGRKSVGKCLAKYEVVFDGLGDISPEVVKIFAETIGRSTTYSYFRSLFASLDWAADLRTPPLPILKSVPKV